MNPKYIKGANRKDLGPISPDTIVSVFIRISESLLATSSVSDPIVYDNLSYKRSEKGGKIFNLAVLDKIRRIS